MRLAIIAAALLAAAFDIGLSTAPRPLFRDVASESGLDFHHVSGAGGEYLMPEIMHGVTPVQPVDPARPAWRDVLVVTYRRASL